MEQGQGAEIGRPGKKTKKHKSESDDADGRKTNSSVGLFVCCHTTKRARFVDTSPGYDQQTTYIASGLGGCQLPLAFDVQPSRFKKKHVRQRAGAVGKKLRRAAADALRRH